MIDSLDDLVEAINSWLRDNGVGHQVDADMDIIDSRIVDSLQFVGLVVHVESLSGADIDVEALGIDDFRTVRRIHRTCFRTVGTG